MVELHSEGESDRTVLVFHDRAGDTATVIVMRRGSRVWLVFNGALKTTVAMTDQEAGDLVGAIRSASR